MITKNGNTININGRIDSNNAAEFEKQLLAALAAGRAKNSRNKPKEASK